MKRKNKIVPYIRYGTKEQVDEFYKHIEELSTPRLEHIRKIIAEREKKQEALSLFFTAFCGGY